MPGRRRVRAARTEAPSLRLIGQPRVGAARSALRLLAPFDPAGHQHRTLAGATGWLSLRDARSLPSLTPAPRFLDGVIIQGPGRAQGGGPPYAAGTSGRTGCGGVSAERAWR